MFDPKEQTKLKKLSLDVAELLSDIGYRKMSETMENCGTYLEIAVSNNVEKIKHANFCRLRFCPACMKRLSLKNFAAINQACKSVKAKHPDAIPLFLTLTIRNCPSDELRDKLLDMNHAWHQMLKNRRIDKSVIAWIRSDEVTYNKAHRTWHPHIHVLLYVLPSYWKNMIKQSDWQQIWKQSAKLDYDPIIDIRRVGKTGKLCDTITAELSKYMSKYEVLLDRDALITLVPALKGIRLIGFGGDIDINFDDDISTDDDIAVPELIDAIRIYRWFATGYKVIKEKSKE